MKDSWPSQPDRSSERSGAPRPRAAREAGGGYDPGSGGGAEKPAAGDVGEALALIAEGLDTLAELELFDETDTEVAEAAIELQRQLNRLQAQQVRLLEHVRATNAHRVEGAVDLTSWYGARAGIGSPAAAKIVRRVRHLRSYDQLRAAYQAGEVSSDHLDPIIRATTARRYPALHDAEASLLTLATRGTPSDVKRAVALIRDHADPDGTDANPLPPGPDDRREVTCNASIDGLGDLHGVLSPEAHELLNQLLDTLSRPDDNDVPAERRRTAAQIRHDTFLEILRRAAAGTGETKNGARPHVNVMIDLWVLLGQAGAATFESRFRRAGIVDDEVLRGLLGHWHEHEDLLTNIILTAGPYRPVAFGNTKRTLPDWLRPLLEHLHHRCRYPYCDRPVAWTEADHVYPWAQTHNTEWDQTLPACRGNDNHHDLHTTGGWSTTYDPHTGIATFTSPSGRQIRTHPPPRRC